LTSGPYLARKSGRTNPINLPTTLEEANISRYPYPNYNVPRVTIQEIQMRGIEEGREKGKKERRDMMHFEGHIWNATGSTFEDGTLYH
jgi:hypothetical protein